MFKSIRRLGSLAAASLLAGLLASTLALAQSADQVEAFRNLSPEQQQAILESMGGSGSQSGVRRDRDLASPETVRPRAVDGTDPSRGQDDDRYTDGSVTGDSRLVTGPRELRVRGRDTVLLDIAIEGLPDAPGQVRTPVPAEDSLLRDEKQTTPRRLDRFTGTRTRQEIEQLEEMRERILRANPYKLDVDGVLRIPGVQPIPLAGLTEAQATERLNLDPALRDFELSLRLLPLQKSGTEALRPFGYNLFAGSPSTFAPVSDAPVPTEYVVGPGDRLEVQLVGNTKGRHSLVVNRDGAIMFPELGPIRVSGLRFAEARARIEARVSEQMIGTQATVSMGDLRSIRVFVLGEAQRPGSYTVSGFATITNALFASGGVTPIGSLRNIQLKRDGRVVTRLDLYDLLLNGDTSDNVRLLPGDVIFIPPVGSTVTVTGEIRRPAIYELAGESSAADLLYLGGGLTPEADPRLAWLERIDQRRDRAVIDIDLTDPQSRGTRLQSGDLLSIPAALPTFANAIEVKGHVFRPGPQQYRSGLRLTDVLRSIDELKPNADTHYVLIRREIEGTRRIQTISADLAQAWQAPTSEANPRLAPRDQVLVFDLETGREQYLAPIIDELKLQAIATEPSRIVRVAGQVRAEGEFPLDPGMRVSDLIRAGGGLTERAYQAEAELARYEARDGQTRRAEVIKVDISRALAGDPAADLLLSPFDLLVIKEISEWSQQDAVRLEGEVRFPGEYPIARGETLRSVIERAGGLTALAFPAGSVFTRESLKERERQQIELLTVRLRQDLSALALQGAQAGGPAAAQASETLSIGQTLLNDLQSVEPVGRLVIDLDVVMAAEPGSVSDLILRDGDRLRIPKQMQEVTVIGEVQNATSHLYTVGLSRDDYLSRSGGATQKADEGRIYVVRANGAVQAEGSRWFRSSGGMQPGDTIVVPLDAERMRPLALWSAVTTILYNIAISVAAVNSF